MQTTLRHLARGAAAFGLIAALGAAVPAQAATITIINNDGANEGFNDPAPRAPVGGNTGTTLGEQRLIVFMHGAAIWGSLLQSDVVIEVRAQFNPQTCTSTSAVLGSAGPVTAHRNFAGADFADTWYHASLANRLAGVDLSPTNPDINTTFNSSLDDGCFAGGVWYYGLDGNEGSNIELLPVVLHELGHGLNFSTLTNGSTGAQLTAGGVSSPAIWDRFLLDNQSGLLWYQMTNAQRQASAINTGRLVWNGPFTTAAAAGFLAKRKVMLVNAPAGIAGSYEVGTASFGPTSFNVTGDVVLVDDGVGTVTDGCEPPVNSLAGKIALIDRGTCAFVQKASLAQAAGAIAVIIANNVAGPAPALGGADPSVTIPTVSISQTDGNTLKANLGLGVNVTLGEHPTFLAGADDAGRVRMYAPNPFQGGSSVSHFDVVLTPNALMEPAINADLHNTVDLTLDLFHDIGWFPLATSTQLAMFAAEGRRDGIAVRWLFQDQSDVAVITLQRASDADGPWAPISTELSSEGGVMLALDTSAEPGQTYWYRLEVIERSGETLRIGLASAQRIAPLAAGAFLSAPQPNPTKAGTSIRFSIGQPEFVKLSVVDAGGRTVRTLHHGMMAPGEYTQLWDGLTDRSGRVAPGVYFVQLRTSDGTTTQRVAMVR